MKVKVITLFKNLFGVNKNKPIQVERRHQVDTEKVYKTLSTLISSTGADRWWTPISEISREKRNILAISWRYILDFAEETGTEEFLKNLQGKEDFYDDMGPFSRAELCYQEVYPDGHKKPPEQTVPPLQGVPCKK